MKNTIALLLVMLITSITGAANAAESVYVIDRLAVGVHEEQDLNSAIVKVLPTGTPLEVMVRDGNFVQVKTVEGVVGWVDATYVMEEKPAQLVLLELESQHADTKNALEAARAEIESLSFKMEGLEAGQTQQDAVEQATSDALRETQRLAQENQLLKDQLASAQAAAVANPTPDANPSPMPALPDRRISEGLGLTRWHWVMIAALMLLAFGAGGYIVDWAVRRRHGGFRV